MFQIGLTVIFITLQFNHFSTKMQANLTNIIANHQLKFQLDVLTCHEGIMSLLEN